jgi:ribosomal protein L10
VVKDTVLEKISFLMHSTENAHKKVKEIKILKVENKELKHELVETTAQLEIAKEEIKKLDSVVTSTKKRNFLQKIVDNLKDTTSK